MAKLEIQSYFKPVDTHITCDTLPKFKYSDIFVFSEDPDPENSKRFMVCTTDDLTNEWNPRITGLYCHLRIGNPNLDMNDAMELFDEKLYGNCFKYDPDWEYYKWYHVHDEDQYNSPAFSFKLIRHVLHLLASIDDIGDPLGRYGRIENFINTGNRLYPVKPKPWYKKFF